MSTPFTLQSLRPLLMLLLFMAVFTLVFGKLARLPSDGMPYPLLVLSGLLPWQRCAGVTLSDFLPPTGEIEE